VSSASLCYNSSHFCDVNCKAGIPSWRAYIAERWNCGHRPLRSTERVIITGKAAIGPLCKSRLISFQRTLPAPCDRLPAARPAPRGPAGSPLLLMEPWILADQTEPGSHGIGTPPPPRKRLSSPYGSWYYRLASIRRLSPHGKSDFYAKVYPRNTFFSFFPRKMNEPSRNRWVKSWNPS